VGLRVNGALDSEHELPRSAGVAIDEDSKGATSEGAMGITLAVANRDHRWRAVRRLQSTVGEGADWLMKNEAGATFILEVKGTDEGPLPLPGAMRQARGSFLVGGGAVRLPPAWYASSSRRPSSRSMNIASLNLRVTDAITVAEAQPKGSPESSAAFREVSLLEDAIARAARPRPRGRDRPPRRSCRCAERK